MKKIMGIFLTILAMLIVPSLIAAQPSEQGGCWVSGIGTISGGEGTLDSFGGNAMTMKDGRVKGEWTHISIGWEVIFHGKVNYIVCKEDPTLPGPGVPEAYPNHAIFGGSGKFNGEDGYFFDVEAYDLGEPGIYTDLYKITIRNGSGIEYQNQGELTGGNFQIHSPNAGHPF